MKKVFFTVAMFSILAFGSAELFAWGGGRGSGYRNGYAAIPNLTAEQSSKIQALQKSHLDEIAPIQENILKKRNELRSQWSSSNPDQAKITSIQKDILNLNSKIQEKSVNLRFEIRKLLTPEQQAQFALNGQGMGGRHGMGGPGMGKSGSMGRW
jgi:Spy/CpxP family protein refolding chaperone